MSEIADRWNQLFWARYATTLPVILQRAQQLAAQQSRTLEEENELRFLVETFSGGFCIGGCCLPDHTPAAFETIYSPTMTGPSPPQPQAVGSAKFWGCPNLIERLIYGVDFGILEAIMQSGKWSGNQGDLIQLVQPHMLGQPMLLPIREAIDWVHASIYATIKTMKFSHLAPVCGGPVEVAVITTDRPFRWVRHKKLDAAIAHDGFSYV